MDAQAQAELDRLVGLIRGEEFPAGAVRMIYVLAQGLLCSGATEAVVEAAYLYIKREFESDGEMPGPAEVPPAPILLLPPPSPWEHYDSWELENGPDAP